MIVNLTENRFFQQLQKIQLKTETELEFIMLLKKDLPPKMYSYGNILPRNYLSYIFEFQLVPFAFNLISGDSLFMSGGTFFQKMLFMRGQILWRKFIVGLFYTGD